YMYMVFETSVRRHVAEIQQFRCDRSDRLKRLQRTGLSFVDASRKFFQSHAGLRFFPDSGWGELSDLAHLRNCIIHNGGVARDSDKAERIYALERRKWSGKAVGLRIERCNGEDIGEPIRIDRRFVDYCLDLLERFFRRLAEAVSG